MMSDISKIVVNNVPYDIKDVIARQNGGGGGGSDSSNLVFIRVKFEIREVHIFDDFYDTFTDPCLMKDENTEYTIEELIELHNSGKQLFVYYTYDYLSLDPTEQTLYPVTALSLYSPTPRYFTLPEFVLPLNVDNGINLYGEEQMDVTFTFVVDDILIMCVIYPYYKYMSWQIKPDPKYIDVSVNLDELGSSALIFNVYGFDEFTWDDVTYGTLVNKFEAYQTNTLDFNAYNEIPIRGYLSEFDSYDIDKTFTGRLLKLSRENASPEFLLIYNETDYIPEGLGSGMVHVVNGLLYTEDEPYGMMYDNEFIMEQYLI